MSFTFHAFKNIKFRNKERLRCGHFGSEMITEFPPELVAEAVKFLSYSR